MILLNICRTLHTKWLSFFPVPRGTFSKTDHIRNKENLNRYKKTEKEDLASYLISLNIDLNWVNKNINNRKLTNTWKLNNLLLNEKGFKTEIRKKLKVFLNWMKMNTAHPILGDTIKVALRVKLIALSVYTKMVEWFYTITLTTHLKVLEQKEEIISKWIRRQEIIKLRLENNVIETNKLRSNSKTH